MKKILLAVSLMLLSLPTFAGKVVLNSKYLEFTETTQWNDQISITFEKCMANNLYTFKEIKLNDKVVNSTSSDNIGPFLVQGGVWLGGNHAFGSSHSAQTMSVTHEIDGATTKRGTFENVKVVHVNVVNELYYYDMEKFADEIVDYYISGNSIEVYCHHDYAYKNPLNVARYYGMQSMFTYETEILLPGTDNPNWRQLVDTQIGNEINITKDSAPNFCTYIEHGPFGYQASYMYREGLGNREWVESGSDVVFIGNSYGKSYHKTIGDHVVKAGDSSDWHGVYTWFSEPIADNCRPESRADDADGTFAYGAYLNGQPTQMKLNADGTMSMQTTGIEDIVVDSDVVGEPVEYYNLHGVKVSNPSAGMYIVRDAAGRSSKILVK